jgi:hypothetical protein
MKHALGLLLTIFLFCSCSNPANYTPATDALDAAREFVVACQQGNFIKANFYMIANEKNKTLLQEAEQTFRQLPAAKRKQYSEASMQEVTIENITPTETIINYKNSYDKVGRKVKAILSNNIWQIDFTYTFNPNM